MSKPTKENPLLDGKNVVSKHELRTVVGGAQTAPPRPHKVKIHVDDPSHVPLKDGMGR